MERIDSTGGTIFRRKDKDEKKIAKKKKAKTVFSSILDSKETAETPLLQNYSGLLDAPIEKLLDEVHEIGEDLKQNPTIQVIHGYKRAVRRFIKYIVDHSLQLEEQTSGGSILKRKRFTLVKIVDEKLERLAAEILQNQRDQLEILKRVDEINGLLVDLVS